MFYSIRSRRRWPVFASSDELRQGRAGRLDLLPARRFIEEPANTAVSSRDLKVIE